VREYVASKIGKDYLIPLLWKGTIPEEIPFDRLPESFVIKATHGCGYNIIVSDKARIDKEKIISQMWKWLKTNYSQEFLLGMEWGYKNIKPHIIIESFIGEKGQPPVDYKFYCFSGHVEVLTLHFERLKGQRTRAFNRDFEPYEFSPNFEQYDGECPRPQNFEALVQVAETLSEDFDFMRVDLYSIDNKIYFGELTPYPGGVSSLRGFDTAKLDKVLGERWQIS
jgi:hypothetical protein